MIQTAQEAVKQRSTAKKVLHIVLKIIAAFIIFVLLFIATVFTVNKISSYSEQKRTEPYGQLVPVDGKQMNVFIQGEGEETIVLLPGYGTAAPGLDFKPLVSELSPNYKVVVVEPFGYGLSNQTSKERTTANIVSEIHEALQSLQIDRYILMAHSISGLYSLDYVNQYPNEVSAYIGLDSSVATLREQKITSSDTKPVIWFRDLGFARIQLKLTADAYEGLPYDEQTKEQINILMRKNMYNSTQLNEAVSMYANYDAAEQQNFPASLPVLFFLQANHPVTDQWIPEHEQQIKDSLQSEIVLLDADHYLYRSHAEEIAEKIRDFTGELN